MKAAKSAACAKSSTALAVMRSLCSRCSACLHALDTPPQQGMHWRIAHIISMSVYERAVRVAYSHVALCTGLAAYLGSHKPCSQGSRPAQQAARSLSHFITALCSIQRSTSGLSIRGKPMGAWRFCCSPPTCGEVLWIRMGAC